MKKYTEYPVEIIGCSDVAALTLMGVCKGELVAKILNFENDGVYGAHIVDEDADISGNFEKIASYDHWMRIYDDNGLVITYYADEITVYRYCSVEYVIQIIGEL